MAGSFLKTSAMESGNPSQRSATLRNIQLLDDTAKSGTRETETVEPVAQDSYLTDSEPDLMSTQDKWLQEIRDSQGDYEQEVTCGHEADLYKRYKSCPKNPGHVQFIDVNTFRSEHLPKRYRSDQKLTDLVRAQANLTCLIKMFYVSPNRPETSPFYKYRGRRDFSRSGTGWVSYVEVYTEEDKGKSWYRPCQCQTCQRSGEPRSEWAMLRICTANHVVFDKSEAEASKCYFFYDNPQQKLTECPLLTGHVYQVWSRSRNDLSQILYYTHDVALARKLKKMRDHYDHLSNLDDLKYKTHVPIRPVVPGRVAEENDDDKNKVPSDKSKEKKTSGHGVQDHFNQGEDCDKENSDDEEDVDNVCESSDDDDEDDDEKLFKPEHKLAIITSHPHGCSKMVTLGHGARRQQEPFEIISYEYSTATCPGSSGAPVFILGKVDRTYYHRPHSRHVRGQGHEQINLSGSQWYWL